MVKVFVLNHNWKCPCPLPVGKYQLPVGIPGNECFTSRDYKIVGSA